MGGTTWRGVVFAACTGAALLAAAACSSSGKASKTPAPATGATATALAALSNPTSTPLSPDAATAVAAKGAVEMVPYTDKDGRYNVKLPRGWPTEGNTNTVTASLAGDPATANPVSATLGIFCLPGADIKAIEAFDQQIFTATGAGKLPLDAPVPAKVGSADALKIYFTGTIGGLGLDRVFVYFVGNGCAWRIQMTAWPGTTLDELKPILEAMMASFTFRS